MQHNRRQVLKMLAQSAALGYLTINGRIALATEKTLQWRHVEPLPMPMQEIYPTAFNGQIFVGGGFVPSDSPSFFSLGPTEKMYIYSPTDNSWQQGPTLPAARHHLGMASNSKYIYGIGGFSSGKKSAWQVTDTVFRKTANDNTWLSGPNLPMPMAESVYAVTGEDIHVIGGKTADSAHKGNFDTDKHFVLLENQHWEPAAPTSLARSSAASTVLDGNIYVIGGRKKGKNAKNLQHMEMYDAKLDKWQAKQPLPLGVAGHTAITLNGKIYVMGGEAFGPGGYWKTGKAFDDVWSYDPVTDKWNREPSMSNPRHGHGAVVLNNNIYVQRAKFG